MTIKRRVRIALFLMVLLPAALMAFAFGFVGRMIEGGSALGFPWSTQSSWASGNASAVMRHGPPIGAYRIVFPSFIALLVLFNGLLSWWVASGIIGPLARLKDSARRIGEGDLGFSVEAGGDDELGEVAAAFETMRAKLAQALERQLAEEMARKELVAHVSHDLRTPIAVIRGHAEGLRDGVAATPQMRERYLGAILDRSRDLEALIDLLFDYSRLDLEGAASRSECLALGPFLAELRDALESSFPEASITLDLDPSAQALRPVVMADPALVRRAMANLVENAVKHGGRERIAIAWKVGRRDGFVDLAVADNGEGLPEADIKSIFEPFFRGDKARERGGSGLGLAIVRRIMETLGGSARAGKGREGGLEVTLTFREAAQDGEADTDHRG